MKTKSFTPAVAEARKQNSRSNIEKKILVLELFINRRHIADTYFPKSLEQFRVWSDNELGIEAIGSKSTLNTIENTKLKDRALRLIEQLKSKHESERPGKSSSEMLREKIRHLETQITALASDYHQCREEFLTEKKKREQAERKAENLSNELRQLRKLEVLPRRREQRDGTTSV